MNNYFTEQVQTSLRKLNENYSQFDERDRLILSFPIFNVPSAFQNDILEAYDHYQDNPDKFDGSTGTNEQWATLYEPAPMRHDRDYQLYGGTYQGRLYADLKFLKIKNLYKTSIIWRNIQYFAVRWGGFYFQFKNWVKGNTEIVSEENLKLIGDGRSKIQTIVEWVGIILIVPILFFLLGACVMDFKHKVSLGWKLSMRWFTSTTKRYLKKIF